MMLFLSKPLPAFDPANFFQQNCVICHGPTGQGDGRVGKLLKPPPPAITKVDPPLIVTTVLNGRGRMPRFAGQISEGDARQLAGYVRSLQP